MSDDDLDADIARLIAQERNRKVLGYSYWTLTGHKAAERKLADEARRRKERDRTRARRARLKEQTDGL